VSTYLFIIQIIISIALTALILIQTKGAGGMGGIFGGDSGGGGGVYKTRRGVERTLFQVTVGLSIVFLVFSVINVLLS
jgi:preprotein translocase subunit SecG